MSKNELIACFKDTLNLSYNGSLRKATIKAQKSNKVYKENFAFASKLRKEQDIFIPSLKDYKEENIIVEANTTFAAVKEKELYKYGKVAVLNFANPENPGGGVQFGAMAQEECLCRSSNLFACLSDSKVYEDFYGYHRGFKNSFYSDRLIYTKDVTVFKNDSTVPQLMPEQDWFNVDVITCSAPYLGKCKYTNLTALTLLLKSRIRNILNAAIDNEVQYLVLGAWGCGAFKNPPLIVAAAFRQVLYVEGYSEYFKMIIFAIKPTGVQCENLKTFREQFYQDEENADGLIGEGVLLTDFPELRYYRTPKLQNEAVLKANQEFHDWQGRNRYFGKQFSILGDSISTLEGYNPRGYKVFYSGENCAKSGVNEMEDTWWEKVIGFFGGELLVNNSWSGSRVTKIPDNDKLFPSGCSDDRTSALHINTVYPDVIIVYLGTNDWAFGARTEMDTHLLGEDDNELFEYAYNSMLQKLKKNYPTSEIWCCTLCETFMSKRPDFKFPHEHAGIHIEVYSEIIRRSARQNECKLVDLYSYNMPYDSLDGSHPTQEGMSTIATSIIRAVSGSEVERFMDCTNKKSECALSEPEISGDISAISVEQKDKLKGIIGRRYSVLKQIGQGSLSQIYLVKDIKSNKAWAMKIYDKTDKRYAPIIRELIMQETAIMMKLDHPAVPRVRDLIEDEKNIFIIREYIEGTTLESIVQTYGAQPAEKVIEWGKQLCDVLGYMHTSTPSYVYRDMKPENIMLTSKGYLKIVDFGTTRVYDKMKRRDTCCLGTRGYAAPEQYEGNVQTDARTDIYGLGMTLHHLVTGVDPKKPPYETKPICQVNQNLPKGLEYIISKCTWPNPDERYQSCTELLKDLNNYVNLPKSKMLKKLSTEMTEEDSVLEAVEPGEKEKLVESLGIDGVVGSVIGERYSVSKQIRQGEAFKIYLVKDIKCNKIWAMEAYDKTNKFFDETRRESVMQETGTMIKLSHPAIPRVIDIIEDEKYIFIVHEYIKGSTLESIVQRSGAQPADKVVQWGKQLCDVIGYMHTLTPPYIYLDMKPENVMLMPDGKLKLIKFAGERIYNSIKEQYTCILRTPGYTAPEGQLDTRNDIYSIGMTMYRLITGVDPEQPPHVVEPICLINPSLPKGLEYIISKCTRPNPAERYQTCGELLDDLNNYLYLPKPKGILGKIFRKK